MAKGNDDLTDEQDGHTTDNEPSLSRRRLLQVAGAGVVGSTFLMGSGDAAETPDRLEIVAPRGSEVSYTFTSGATIERVQTNSFVSTESDEDSVTENDDGTWTATGTTADGYADAFDLHGDVHSFEPKTGEYALYLNGTRISRDKLVQPPTRRLVIETPSDGAVDYSFTTTGEITKLLDNGDNSAESSNDSVSENSDGSWTATGMTGNGYGDAYEFAGTVQSFSPKEGSFTLYLDGQEVTAYALVGEQPPEDDDTTTVERDHSYSFEGTGDSWADYYLEVEDGGEMIASTLDGAVIEPDFHWVSEDGTKAAGRVDPGERHAYEFNNLVLDVTIEGEADAFVDGSSSKVSRYPQPGATGDDWKGGFPWQEDQENTTVERDHSYSFEGTGDSWADYYLEVEDGGEMIASTIDGAVIEPDFHWISEDGTKAAGRVDPGERHAYEFNNLVLDVTIVGDADAYVDGSSSKVSRYPLSGASGDDWKGGFPWQDGDEGQPEPEPAPTDGVAMGGGSGYENIVTRDDADVVVSSASELDDELSSASSGDIVFVAGDAVIDTDNDSYDVPSGVTLASNRGQKGAPGALLHTNEMPQVMLRPQDDARVTGLRIRGPTPGETVTHRDGISVDSPTQAVRMEGGDVEVDNCEVWGWSDRAINVKRAGGYVHHNYVYDNNGQGLGYGVAANEECLIEYNYFHNNRHSVTCAYDAPGYTARYNHFSSVTVLHICDVHDPFEGDTTIDSNVIENGETRTWDAVDAEGIAGYSGGFDGGSLTVTDNWFFDQDTAYFDNFGEVDDSGNVYGGEGSNDPADVIPNHPGMDHRPWL